MVLVEHPPQSLPHHVGVDLGGGDVGVAEHHLDAAQVRAALEQVRSEAVPQDVRRQGPRHSRLASVAPQPVPEGLAREALPAAGHKQVYRSPSPQQARPGGRVALEGLERYDEETVRRLATFRAGDPYSEQALLDYADASAQVVRAQAALETARDAMNDTKVRAPVSGTLIAKNVELGTVISSPTRDVGGGTVLMRMANLDTVQIRTLVDETDIGKVQPGMEAMITVDAYPNRPFLGRVLKIEPQATVQQNVTMFPALVRIANPNHLLMPGMNAEVQIQVGTRENVLAIPYAALRYANVYGPRQDPHGEAGVVALFTLRLLQGRPAIINGDGMQTRDYVHVRDAVKANLSALDRGNGMAINIGTGIETDVNSLFRKLKELTGSRQQEIHGDPAAGEQRRSVLENRMAFEELGWYPEISLEEGLSGSVAFFREKNQKPDQW